MAMLGKGVELVSEQLSDIGLPNLRRTDDNRAGRDVSQPLPPLAQQARSPSDQVECRQQIHKSQQVSDNDLGRSQTQSAGFDDPQAEQALPDRLSSPEPFSEHAIEQRDD